MKTSQSFVCELFLWNRRVFIKVKPSALCIYSLDFSSQGVFMLLHIFPESLRSWGSCVSKGPSRTQAKLHPYRIQFKSFQVPPTYLQLIILSHPCQRQNLAELKRTWQFSCRQLLIVPLTKSSSLKKKKKVEVIGCFTWWWCHQVKTHFFTFEVQLLWGLALLSTEDLIPNAWRQLQCR